MRTSLLFICLKIYKELKKSVNFSITKRITVNLLPFVTVLKGLLPQSSYRALRKTKKLYSLRVLNG